MASNIDGLALQNTGAATGYNVTPGSSTPPVGSTAVPQSSPSAGGVTVTAAQLQSAIASSNQVFSQTGSNVELSYDDKAQETVIKLVDTKSGDVLRQYPSKEVLAIAQALGEVQTQISNRDLSSQSAGEMVKGILIKQQS
jgi:flagellar protein FlaG